MTVRFNWGTGIALVYTAFAAGTLGMVVLASRTHVDLVSDDYYARSLTVDRHLAAVENGRAAGVGVSMERTAGPPALRVTWPAGAAGDRRGTLTLYRPSASAADRTIDVPPSDAADQVIPLPSIPAGHWQAQLQWTSGGREYYVERDIVTP